MKTNTLDFDAQALREKILDLAMRGKLVPQDPNDEPASVLLEKIKAEKEQLIKEKKIKKSKPLAPITDDEKLFDIPDSWEWVRLGDVGLLKNGKTPKKEDISSDNIYPYFKVKDMNNNNLYMENVKNWVGEKYSRQVMPKNTIIFPKNGGAILTAKKRILSQDSLVDLNTGGLIPYNDLNHKFIFYLFLSLDIKDFVKGSAVPTINSKKLKETLVPLPPLEEQSRIAAKIAQLFALLRKVESSTQQYAKLLTLLKSKVLDLAMRGKLVEQDTHDEPASVLLEKIKAEKAEIVKEKKIKKSKPLPPITDEEKPFDIPDSWEWVRLGDVYHFVDYRGKTPHKISSGIRLITAKNVRNGYIKLEPEEFISLEEHKERSTRGLINKGDIFITTEAPMGLVALNNFDEPIATAQRLITLQKVSKYQDSSFAAFQMQSSFFQKELQQKATGSTVKGIKASNLKQVLILIPPLAEQRRTVKKISQVLKLLK